MLNPLVLYSLDYLHSSFFCIHQMIWELVLVNVLVANHSLGDLVFLHAPLIFFYKYFFSSSVRSSINGRFTYLIISVEDVKEIEES